MYYLRFFTTAHFSTTGQEYSQVVKMLGNGRCECFCFDGVTRLGHIRGKMRKKVWITAGDIVLVAKRDFQDEKVDIVHKYTADEARNLKQYGELPETARINETAVDIANAGTIFPFLNACLIVFVRLHELYYYYYFCEIDCRRRRR